MSVYEWLSYIAIGVLLGILGQGVRVIVGLKKANEQAALSQRDFQEILDLKRLTVSLLIGGISGGIGAIVLLENEINKELLLTLVSTGYSGTDFIEGFMRTKTPQ
ncbi:hypothetical protein [Leptolyngbya ohadii]|uniref:hypothetical protein n=1 Tax=Leptolyngbya ohadii TaxID=1962290 RepID=UPI000B59E8E4|nr:hypothetical protein [Leptolyngbya ohadii]